MKNAMIIDLLENCSVSTIEKLMEGAPAFLEREIRDYDANCSEWDFPFAKIMQDKRADEELLDRIWMESDEDRLFDEVIAWHEYRVDESWIDESNVLGLYRILLQSIRDGDVNEQYMEEYYPAFKRAIDAIDHPEYR